MFSNNMKGLCLRKPVNKLGTKAKMVIIWSLITLVASYNCRATAHYWTNKFKNLRCAVHYDYCRCRWIKRVQWKSFCIQKHHLKRHIQIIVTIFAAECPWCSSHGQQPPIENKTNHFRLCIVRQPQKIEEANQINLIQC